MRQPAAALLVLLAANGLGFSNRANSIPAAGGGRPEARGMAWISAARNAGAASPSAAAPQATAKSADKPTDSAGLDLVAFSSGALIVKKPQEYGAGWAAFWLLDERPNTGWATPKGVISP